MARRGSIIQEGEMLRQCSTDTSPRLVPTPGKVIFFQVCSYVLPTTFPALDFVKSRPS